MEQVKVGKMFEDDTTTINQVAESLHSVGIEMMKDADTFRPMGDVLQELGERWDTLTQKQQNLIAGTVAGLRQAPQFISLMTNWAEVSKALGIEMDSAGLAAQRYAIYQDNIEAAMNRSTAAWEGFWQVSTRSDQIKWFYDLSAAIGKSLTVIGGLPPILIVVIGLLIALKGEVIKTAIAVNLATGGIPLIIGAIVAAIGIGWMAINGFSKSTGEKLDEINTKIEEYKTNLEGLKTGADRLGEIGDEYETLRKKATLTNEEQKRFIELQNIIHGILPQVSGDYDELGNYTLDAGTALSTLIDLQKEEIRVMREKLQLETLTGAEVRIKNLKDLQAEQDKLNAKLDEYEAKVGRRAGGRGGGILVTEKMLSEAQSEATEKSYELQNAIDDERIKYLGLSAELRELQLLKYKELGLTEDVIRAISGEVKGREKLQAIIEQGEKAVVDYAKELENLSKAMDAVTSALKEETDEGHISNETIISLIQARSSLIDYIEMGADGYYHLRDGVQEALFAEMKLLFVENDLGVAAIYAANGNYKLAASMIVTSKATDEVKQKLLDLLKIYAAMGAVITVPSVGGGGSGGGGESALDKMISQIKEEKNAEKEALEARKDALREQLDNYKKIIEARKDLLRSLKEEIDYKKELAEKEKSVSKIQTELLSLSLDNSEEAKAKRLELQEDLIKAQDDLDETQRDRQYDLEMEALDKELSLYEDFINGQIKALDSLIKVIVDFVNSMKALTEAAMTRVGNAGVTGARMGTDTGTDVTKKSFQKKLVYPLSSGGLITGGTPGQDSVHSILTPGEYVFTKDAVDKLGTPLLNQLNRGIYNAGIPGTNNIAGLGAKIGTLLSINVEGNLDRSVVPDLQTIAKQMMGELNKNLLLKGFMRSTNQYAS